MPTFRFEGWDIPFEPGDTLATALHRAGIRVFTRSFKYHRPRGLYCLSGDCPNCFLNVDGVPGVRACVTPAGACSAHREGGFPSTRFDLLRILDHLHRLMPVGFYYKTFIRPRWAWPVAQRVVERATGLGALPMDRVADQAVVDRAAPDVLVIGAGLAGLAAAVEAAEGGASVIVCDEGLIGDGVSDLALVGRLRGLADRAASAGATVLERSTAVGIYDGPLVPITGNGTLLMTHPGRVVVATGATDRHEVFRGNDLPGVWQGRAAATLVRRHGLRPGARAVVLGGSHEAPALVRTLTVGGVEIVAVVVPPADDPGEPPAHDGAFGGARAVAGEIERAHGRRCVRAVSVRTAAGMERIRCDAVIVSRALVARDVLLRMGQRDPAVVGAGDVMHPGIGADDAAQAGRRAAWGRADAAIEDATPPVPRSGVVCLCEDVSAADLLRACDEGFDTSEMLKRYTTASMGPCQGVQCGRYVACMATPTAASTASGPDASGLASARTTARPPARTVALEQLAGLGPEVILRRTALHDTHRAAGAQLGPSGAWVRAFHYGDPRAEYRAVRERVSIMDVSTLGKFLITGPDAAAFVDHVFPGRIADLAPGRARYVLMLDDAGYVADDGMLVALPSGGYSLTTTSGGAGRAAGWLELVADRRGADVHVVDLTEVNGAILVAGPRSRALLQEITDDDVSSEAFPYMAQRDLVVGGIECSAMRVGFVGELSFELHHRRDRSVPLWAALSAAGSAFDLVPHGLDALDVLRLEKGHLYIGQDTLPDDTPRKLGLERMVDMGKGDFVGRAGLVRLDGLPQEQSLAGLSFGDGARPDDLAGQPIWLGGDIVGRVTSCEFSPTLGGTIGLGWLHVSVAGRSDALRAADVSVRRVPTPFIDPEGSRVRG